jgi:hypothetical protein
MIYNGIAMENTAEEELPLSNTPPKLSAVGGVYKLLMDGIKPE